MQAFEAGPAQLIEHAHFAIEDAAGRQRGHGLSDLRKPARGDVAVAGSELRVAGSGQQPVAVVLVHEKKARV